MMQPSQRTSGCRILRRTRSCQLERLESRDLLAGDVPLQFTGGASSGVLDEASLSGSISGQVLLAADHFCALNSGTPVENVTLRLLGEQGEFLSQAQSDDLGAYRFDDLVPGVYAVQQIQPSDLQSGKAHAGSGGGIVFESNLIGEIALDSGFDLISYNFCESPLPIDPEQNESADRAIEAHGSGNGETSAQQLVGVAQRFGQLADHVELTEDKYVGAEDYDEQVADEAAATATVVDALDKGSSSKAKRGSSQEVKSRPLPEHDSIPEEFWDELESIGIDTLRSVADELPWMGAQDSTPTVPPESQTRASAQENSKAEDKDYAPAEVAAEIAIAPTHVATNVNNLEGADTTSPEQVLQ